VRAQWEVARSRRVGLLQYRKSLALCGADQARIKAYDVEVRGVVIGGGQSGRKLQAVCGAERVDTEQALGGAAHCVRWDNFLP
jgi:hypothetical protein